MAGEEAWVRGVGTNWFYRALNNNESNYEITPTHTHTHRVSDRENGKENGR